MVKAIIFDSGTLITLAMNSLLDIVRNLKKEFNGKFIITREIEYEVVKHPMNILKYKLEAMMIKSLIDDKIIEFPDSVGIKDSEINSKTQSILKYVNGLFQADGRNINLIHGGEASSLALSIIMNQKNIKNMIAIDERTTRLLIEKPDNLRSLLEEKLNTRIKMNPISDELKKITFMRSSELVYIAYKKGLTKPKTKDMLDAMLYGTKFKGCAISNEEIKELEKLG
ncbi:MAG: hypothetical protein WC781_00925 [Candidatus Pacearchaeota archaeon]|jgi:hypothetical protein